MWVKEIDEKIQGKIDNQQAKLVALKEVLSRLERTVEMTSEELF